jgi:hypothetical protein
MLYGLAALLVAGGMGWCWFLVTDAGWGYRFLTGLLLALPVVLACYLAVGLGHCRNSWVAGTLAFFAAVVYHAGFFYVGLVHMLGPQALWRIELLPEFTARHLAADAALLAGNRMIPGGEATGWLIVGIDIIVVFLVIVGAAIYRSLRGYCETCRHWMRSIPFHAISGTGKQIARALARDLSAVPVTAGRGLISGPFASVEFEYCPGLREPGNECEAYLTLKEFPGGTKKPETLLYQGRLQSDELAVLAERVAPLGWLRVSAPPTNESEEISGPPVADHAGATATLERLPPNRGATALDRSGRVDILLGLASSAIPLVGFALTVWGVLRAPWADPAAVDWLGWLLLAAGLASASLGGLLCWVNVDYLGQRFAYRSMCGVIAERPDAMVAVSDPAARFVEIVPRAQWHQLNPDKPAERGLLILDPDRCRLVFEGMKERYVIPVDAVIDCAVEPILPHTGRWNIFATVLTVRYPAGGVEPVIGGRKGEEWEIPFLPRPTEFRRNSVAYRRALAESLCNAIEELLPRKRVE